MNTVKKEKIPFGILYTGCMQTYPNFCVCIIWYKISHKIIFTLCDERRYQYSISILCVCVFECEKIQWGCQKKGISSMVMLFLWINVHTCPSPPPISKKMYILHSFLFVYLNDRRHWCAPIYRERE